jgi:hypothetical protein
VAGPAAPVKYTIRRHTGRPIPRAAGFFSHATGIHNQTRRHVMNNAVTGFSLPDPAWSPAGQRWPTRCDRTWPGDPLCQALWARDAELLRAREAGRHVHADPSRETGSWLVYLAFHVVRNDAGAGGIPRPNWTRACWTWQEAFAPTGHLFHRGAAGHAWTTATTTSSDSEEEADA